MKGLCIAFLAVNLLGVVFFAAMSLEAITAVHMVSGRYTALDRDGVINQQALAKSFPKLATNDRLLVPSWMAEHLIMKYHTVCVAALCVATINALLSLGGLIGLARKSRLAPSMSQAVRTS
jgi:hypothetical protein